MRKLVIAFVIAVAIASIYTSLPHAEMGPTFYPTSFLRFTVGVNGGGTNQNTDMLVAGASQGDYASYNGIRITGPSGGGSYFDLDRAGSRQGTFYTTNTGGVNISTVGSGTLSFGSGNPGQWEIRNGGQMAAASGSTPTIGACGTSPSVAGKDNALVLTVGTGAVATSCAATFGQTWLNSAPVCIGQSNNTADAALAVTTTTTTVTLTKATALTASSLINVICFGRS